jgi:hypothetical protein
MNFKLVKINPGNRKGTSRWRVVPIIGDIMPPEELIRKVLEARAAASSAMRSPNSNALKMLKP